MIRFRLYFDKDKEATWLNEMADNGHAMTGFFMGFYKFTDCEPGKYEYAVDFSDSFGEVKEEYRDLMKDMNIEIVQLWGQWVILRKLKADGPLVLYSDVDSQIEHYSKIKKMFKVVTIFEIIILFVEAFCTAMQITEGNVSSALLTLGFTLLIAAIVFTLASAITRTEARICDLREKKTGIAEERKRKVSMYLAFGLLLNSFSLLFQELPFLIKLPIQIAALIFMCIGIYFTLRKEKESKEDAE